MASSEDVYCTLVLNDTYLPGASVLAHSLKDCGTTRKLACLVTPDTLSAEALNELRSLFNYVISVPRVGNPSPSNLYLMDRPDLLYAFTKIHLWRQTQFQKIVYVDADVVALRAPEELFEIPEEFAAAPDVGWPDAFNTGVMVLAPNEGIYRALQHMAAAGDSFDGADQGLINQYFENKPWKRLSFTYNCTPSASYQYEPAYRYNKSKISLLHFIGRQKPWMQPRSQASVTGVYQELLSRWWAVYDRHHLEDYRISLAQGKEPASSAGYGPDAAEAAALSKADVPLSETPGSVTGQSHASNIQSQTRDFQAPRAEWDATRAPPPIESRPEAANFPSQIYEFNADPSPFQPPSRYPDPPRNMWFEIPSQEKRKKPYERPPAIFPWEEREIPVPSRRFIEDEPDVAEPLHDPASTEPDSDVTTIDIGEFEVEADGSVSSSTPTIRVIDSSTWNSSSPVNKNAWDEVSGIDSYVRALTSKQKSRGNVQVLQNTSSADDAAAAVQGDASLKHADLSGIEEAVRERRESLILTDFPTAIERPSLPVTPAPRRRTTFWGDERDDEGNLPVAEGVPDQADWNPAEQLEQLRRSSLLGPEQLKLPTAKIIPDRVTIPSAMALPDEGHPRTVASPVRIEEAT